MFFSVLFVLVVVQALSESPPAPQNIHVDNWLLTWTPASEGDTTYTVQYSRFNNRKWTNVSSCVHISSNSCNVTSTKAEAEHGCVRLRVRAERRGLPSPPVEACSRHGDTCTPDLSLMPGPGSLTVYLTMNHSLAQEYGRHAKYRVYYGKEGEPLLANSTKYEDAEASVTISELQEGQRYCVQVQYRYFKSSIGLPTCTQCELIPESKKDSNQTVILVVGPIMVPVLLIPLIAYFLICKSERIKQWLRPPYELPEDFLESFPEHHLPISSSSPTEECWDVISSISPQE
ncbi:interferon gamma receptor 2 isoform X1 [Sander lucioperca]|uniref:interferon gamma receptor 2 isoform X1 n=1 Tax=Sander lucioperca TaxID=283035 RepID=UPI00125D2B9D|nr:interferon gamma receptor 2 isoform X1 [Sander lucioperca]